MQRNFLFIVSRSAIALTIAVLFASLVDAQMFGIPAPEKGNRAWKEVTALMPEDEPIACWIWNEAGTLNPEGNPSEQWLADAGLQKSFGKLRRAIALVAKENGTASAAQFAEDIGWKMLGKAGMFVVEKVSIEAQTGNGTFIVRLGDDEKTIEAFMHGLMDELEVEANIVGETKLYTMPDSPIPIVVGVHSGYLIAALGNGQWETITQRIDDENETPDWLKKRLAALPVSRRSQFAFGSVAASIKLLPPAVTEDPEFQRISESLALEGIKSFSVSSGTDSVSNVSMMHFECDKEGLTSVFDVPAIKKSKLKEIPADSIAALAIRFSPENVMGLIEATVPPDKLEEAMLAFTEQSGLDVKKDLVDHLEGTIRYYNTGSVIAPKQVGIIRINDELKFRKSYDQINETIEGLAIGEGLEFTEKEKNGLRVFGVKNDGVSFYWALSGGELYLSSNSRAIGSHIRKYTKGNKDSLLDSELATKILTESKAMGLEGPIMMQHYDFDQIIEVVVPLIQGAFAFIPAEARDAFDFGAGDFPPIESLLGLRPTRSMLFKASGGYTGISRYDTPAPMELSTIAVSGVAVGMLLPAVQQVREAARRTQSMNNQRQLVLAMLNYESVNGSFPPAYTTDGDGNPLLSWRVAILPYLEQQDLFDQFHHDEPWDSPHNITLLEQMPDLFQNPSAIGRPGQTDYLAPIGEDSILSPGAGVTMDAITDGTSNTVLVMEVGMDQQVPWSSPQDLEIDLLESLNIDNGHPGTVGIALCDGSVHSILKSTSVEEFIKWCKKSDGTGFNETETE